MNEEIEIPKGKVLIFTRKWWQSLGVWLLLLGLVLYVLVYWYQSGSVTRNANYHYRAVIPVSDDVDSLTLDVLYPKQLRLDSTSGASQTVEIALWYTTPPKHKQPYTFTFTVPITPVIMTDRKGHRIASRFVITPDIGRASPIVFNIERAMLSEGEPAQITPTLSVRSSLGNEIISEEFKSIELERCSAARWRRFLSLIFAPTTPLLMGAAGLVALAAEEIRNWLRRTREERKVAALTKIRSLASLLNQDLSEAARRYIDLKQQTSVIWEDKRLKEQLQDVWSKAPENLQHTVEVLSDLTNKERFYDAVENIGPDCSLAAIKWAHERLDEDWQQRAYDALILLCQHSDYRRYIDEDALRSVEQRAWHAILEAWPHISFRKNASTPSNSRIARGLEYLGLEGNPFGSEKAETDTLLLECRVRPPWFENLDKPQPALLIGPSGSGKTATALLLAYDSLVVGAGDSFPVYFPASLDILELDEIARVLAKILLHYLAVAPTDFLRCKMSGKAAIARLLARYVHGDLKLQFHQAGLPRVGKGPKMIQEIENLIQDVSLQEPLPDEELLYLLSRARPHSFQSTTILLDVQKAESNETASDVSFGALLDLVDMLARGGVFVKAFFPDTFQDSLRQRAGPLSIEIKPLQWEDDDLLRLLKTRMMKFRDETLAAWCDPGKGDLSPNARLIGAAQGTPGDLIRKGNELLRRIGQNERRLTARDLDEILGALPPSSDEAEL